MLFSGENTVFSRKTVLQISRSYNTPMFTALSRVAKRCTNLKWPSTHEKINKMWCVHKIEYYLALKKNIIWPENNRILFGQILFGRGKF